MRRRGETRGGTAFSLIEVLVVIVILVILALVLLPRLTGGKDPVSGKRVAAPRERARQVQGLSYAQQINAAIQMYRDDNEGRNPAGLAELKRYGVTDEMLNDPSTGQPLAYDPQTGQISGGGAPALPRVPGF